MNIEDFQTAGEWYRKMKTDDFIVPLSLYYALVKLMDDKQIPFSVAYHELLASGQIKIVHKTVIFDLNKK